MTIKEFRGKSKETLLEESLKELNVTEKEVMYTIEEDKGGLFKSKQYILKLSLINDVADYLVEFLEDLTRNMNLNTEFTTKIKEEQITISMNSNNNAILIGKNGKTLAAIQTILRQLVFGKINKYPYILLDVENYKEKQQEHLERTAKKIAYEVQKTKVDAALDPMNSYERRLIHNALGEIENITTTSEGDEPNRYVVIKYKK